MGKLTTLKFIKNLNHDQADIFLFDQIGQGAGQAFANEMQLLNERGFKIINVFINSPGGNVLEGFGIFSAIMASKAKVHTHIVGIAASIAGIIALAGDKIFMVDFGRLMVHGPSFDGNGKMDKDEKAAHKSLTESLTTILKNRTSKDEEELIAFMSGKEDIWVTPEEALEGGFIDEIVSTTKSDKRLAARMPMTEMVALLGLPKAENTFNINIETLVENINARIKGMTSGHEDVDNAIAEAVAEALNDKPAEKPAPKILSMKDLAKFLKLNVEATEDSIINAVQVIITERDKLKSELEAEKELLVTAKATIETQNTEIQGFKDKAKEASDKLVEDTIDKAIEDKKIDPKQKDELVEKFTDNPDGLTMLMGAIKDPAVTIIDKLNRDGGSAEISEKRKDWGYKEWLKEDSRGLESIIANDPDTAVALYMKSYPADKHPQVTEDYVKKVLQIS